MNPNWLGILSALLAFGLFFATYLGMRRKEPKTRIILTILFAIAAIPGASFSIYYAHIIPDSAWYFQFRSIPGTELLVVFIGVAAGLIATLPRTLLLAPLLGVAAFSITPIIKLFIGPISKDSFTQEWDDGVCLQSTASTCGAASTATIINHLGGNVQEAEIAKEAHSYAGGTEAWYLARAVRKRGFKAHFDFYSGFAPEAGLPAIVGVKLGAVGHFIAVLGKENDHFIVGDPLIGREILSWEDLHERYEFTGFHLRIQNSENP